MMRSGCLMALALAGTLGAAGAEAACRIQTSGARCVTAGSGLAPAGDETRKAGEGTLSGHFRKAKGPKTIPDAPEYAPGDVLPGDVTVLFNRARYDLPAPRDGWTYFRVGHEIYRADMFTRVVIDRVNDHMSIRY